VGISSIGSLTCWKQSLPQNVRGESGREGDPQAGAVRGARSRHMLEGLLSAARRPNDVMHCHLPFNTSSAMHRFLHVPNQKMGANEENEGKTSSFTLDSFNNSIIVQSKVK
jgi:hypothetical protein